MVPMKAPTEVSTPGCPSCGGHDWKRAKMIVLEGSTRVDTKSSGDSLGVGAGVGRGHGGVGISYQTVDLATTGSVTQDYALEYAPPTPPPQYDQRDVWRARLEAISVELGAAINRIDEFALDPKDLKPGLFGAGGEPDVQEYKSKYAELRSHLEQILEYERSRALWDKTRVCTRCGERYISSDDARAILPSFRIPEFGFNGQGRCCPKCGKYGWKQADVYVGIRQRRLNRQLSESKRSLKEAQEAHGNPPPVSIWKRIGNKLFVASVEDAQSRLDRAERDLRNFTSRAMEMETKWGPLHTLRLCSSCKEAYRPETSGESVRQDESMPTPDPGSA